MQRDCPFCPGSLMPVSQTDGLYECPACGKRTHEKIEQNRDAIADLAESDSPASWVAKCLLSPETDA
jgi:uncharacterized Zn finger protein (UPF0148 family)